MPCIQMNLPVYKDYLYRILNGLIVIRIFLEKKGKNVILGNAAFCIGIVSTDFSLPVTCMAH